MCMKMITRTNLIRALAMANVISVMGTAHAECFDDASGRRVCVEVTCSEVWTQAGPFVGQGYWTMVCSELNLAS
jgi:hypothetical protein